MPSLARHFTAAALGFATVLAGAACGSSSSSSPDANGGTTPSDDGGGGGSEGSVAPGDDGGPNKDGSGPPSGRCDPKKPFAPAVDVSEITTSMPGDPWLTHEELTIYFEHETAPPKIILEMMVATRASITAPFGAPVVVTVPNATGDEATPSLSADGLSLTFARGEIGDPFHRVTRPTANAPFANDTTITAGAPKPRKGLRVPRVALGGALYYLGIYDATYAVYRDAPGGGTTPVLSNSGDLFGLSISSDEKTLYVAGPDAGNKIGSGRATRTDVSAPFPTPTQVTELVGPADTNGFELSWVSDDDCVAYGTFRTTLNGQSRIVRATRGN